ncbi:MAG: type II toxin-antitoxin system prevent-host-death family antitoxin [Oscillospiraceae bacterium]|jgi:prevent-host-death family protein|nr:type II toxin-antitoxin system prevent-host-death family antitoxin [Oscillospiraceae bacterium]
MPNIKPVSDLRNYGEVLRHVAIGSPVFLTKNGQGRYAVMDIEEYGEYEKLLAWRKLKSELDEGRCSGEENGWLSAAEVRAHFGERRGG